MSDALTREQLHTELSKVLLNGQPFDAILAHDAAQRATIARLERDADHTTCNKLIAEVYKKTSDLEARLAAVTADEEEAVQRATAFEREIDQLRQRLAAVTAEKDRLDAEVFGLQAALDAETTEKDKAVRITKALTEPAPLTEADKEWATDTVSVVDRLKRELAAVTEERNQHEAERAVHFAEWQTAYTRWREAERERDAALATVQEFESEVWKAHVPVTGTQHDPTRGLLHGYCERCRDVWPCQYAPERNAQFQAEQRVAQLEGAARKVWETIPATYGGTAEETHARALVELNALVQQALQPPAPTMPEE